MHSLFAIFDMLLGFLQFMMLVYGIMSLLLALGILKPYGRVTAMAWQNLQGLFDPLLRPLRRFLPPYRGFDWSFLVLYLLIVFLRMLLVEYGLTAPTPAGTVL